jgi:hypothetical protein
MAYVSILGVGLGFVNAGDLPLDNPEEAGVPLDKPEERV